MNRVEKKNEFLRCAYKLVWELWELFNTMSGDCSETEIDNSVDFVNALAVGDDTQTEAVFKQYEREIESYERRVEALQRKYDELSKKHSNLVKEHNKLKKKKATLEERSAKRLEIIRELNKRLKE